MERPADNPYIDAPDTDFADPATLSKDTARQQVEALREAIRYHDYRYYVEADPILADRTYDALFDRLRTLEEAFDLQSQDSPTQRVGGEPVEELDTVEHVTPMLSIDASGDAADVRAFDTRVRQALGDDEDAASIEYVCEPKFDGLSLEVVYEEGRFVRAATRGDGETGDDVTRAVRTIGAVPQRLVGDYPDFLAVRGEVYMPRAAFQSYNRERVEAGEEPFANPRNAAVGSLRQLDPSVTAERPLSVYFYDVLEASDPFESHHAEHETLPDYGLRVNDEWYEAGVDIEAAIEFRDQLLAARDALDYEVDGVVIKVNDRAACETLGATARAVRWAYAYKFPPRSEETTVRQITVQVGRTGRLTPVALLDPVDVGGVTVSRATLHNRSEIAELGVDVGDKVRVERAGDVIPYVEAVVEENSQGHFEMPATCPVCDSPVEHDGPQSFCTGGLACGAQLRRAIEHYASDRGLDIEGLGPENVDQLVEAGLVASLADLYELDASTLAGLAGWGEQSARNLVAEIDASRKPPLDDFLAAIGVPEVGPTVAADLARHFGTLDAIMEASESELQAVDGIGPAIAGEIRGFFESPENRAAVETLREHVEVQSVDTETGTELEGLTFVFTGSVDGWTRTELTEVVEGHGGRVTSSVSGNTDYLVVGANPGATKQSDADAEDVPAITPEEFFGLLADRGIAVE
ncbi:MAG: NAD-dependent DNA ligase LigA [Halobacteriaceae archaeon]